MNVVRCMQSRARAKADRVPSDAAQRPAQRSKPQADPALGCARPQRNQDGMAGGTGLRVVSEPRGPIRNTLAPTRFVRPNLGHSHSVPEDVGERQHLALVEKHRDAACHRPADPKAKPLQAYLRHTGLRRGRSAAYDALRFDGFRTGRRSQGTKRKGHSSTET